VRERGQRADIGAAVMTVMLPELFGFEMTAKSSFDFFPGKKFLDGHSARRRERPGIVFAIDSFDELP